MTVLLLFVLLVSLTPAMVLEARLVTTLGMGWIVLAPVFVVVFFTGEWNLAGGIAIFVCRGGTSWATFYGVEYAAILLLAPLWCWVATKVRVGRPARAM